MIYSGIFGSLFGLCMGIVLTTANASIGKFLGDSSIVLRSRIRLVETLSIKKFSAEVVKTPNLKRRKQSTVREKLLIGLVLVLYDWMLGNYFGLFTSNEGIVLRLFLGIYLIKIDSWIETLIFKSSQGKKQKLSIEKLKITRRWKIFIEATIITIILVVPLIKIIGIFASLVFGTILGLLTGGKIIQGEQQERISIMLASPFKKTIALNIVRPPLTERIEPNQGIRKSALNAIKYALIVELLAASITGYIEWHAGLSSLFGGFIIGILSFGLISWFIAEFLLGGKAVIQHFVLRSILCLSGSYPWNYAQFLEYANELMFMQKSGGRYQFIHDLLQEHFAQMEANQKQIVDTMR